MHHPDHSGGGCPKCIINTRLIAPLATMLANDSTGAEYLARASAAAVGVYDALGLKDRPASGHKCEHAAQLIKWINDPETADGESMHGWADEILDDIEELIG